MIEWTVEAGEHGGWSVVLLADGSRTRVRPNRLGNLSCITAQVIAAEFNEAYKLGRNTALYEVFGTVLD